MAEHVSAQSRIEQNFDRELNQQKDTRRVEWLSVLCVLAVCVALFGYIAVQYVRQAWAVSYQQSARAARVAVQIAAELCRQEQGGAFDYVLGVTPSEDDENGALLRAALGSSMPRVSGARLGGGFSAAAGALAESAQAPDQSLPPLVFSASQQNGSFTLRYWHSEGAWLAHPDRPDCTWAASGDPALNLAGAQGSFS